MQKPKRMNMDELKARYLIPDSGPASRLQQAFPSRKQAEGNLLSKVFRNILLPFLCLFIYTGAYTATSDSIRTQKYHDIEAYVRISGIVRYYSPNPYTEKWDNYDWICIDYANIAAIEKGEPLTDVLKKYLAVFAPNGNVSTVPQDRKRRISGTSDEYCYRLHHGSGEVRIPATLRIFHKELRNYRPFYTETRHCPKDTIDTAIPQADSIYSYKVSDNLYLNIPIAEKGSTFLKKAVSSFLKESRKTLGESMKKHGRSNRDKILGLAGDKSFRYADIATRWNIIQHFYPYHQEDSMEWENHLVEMLETVDTLKNGKLSRSDMYDYYNAILQALNPVKDSHLITYKDMNTGSLTSFYLNTGYAPVMFTREGDGRITVKDSIAREVLEINGISSSSAFENAMKKVNASSYAAMTVLALKKMTETGNMGDPLILKTRDLESGRIICDTLYGDLSSPMRPAGKDQWASVKDSVLIFNPGTAPECYKAFRPYLDSIAEGRYKALVFDLRSYPALDFDKVLSHITDTTMNTSALFHKPLSCFPNREHIRYSGSDGYIKPVLPHIGIPVSFISGPETMSWGETILMLVKGYGLGEIIGTPTNGTNGDATYFSMPLFSFYMTAIKAVNADGSRHHGIGVIPDRKYHE